MQHPKKTLVIAHSDLSSSIAMCDATTVINPDATLTNYNDFTWVLTTALSTLSEDDPVDVIYIIGFIVRESHLKQLITAYKNKTVKKVVHLSHVHDSVVYKLVKDHKFFETVGGEPDNKVSVAILTHEYFRDKTEVFPANYLHVATIASHWTMHDFEATWDGMTSVAYMARAFNDIFTDFSRASNGAVRAGRHLQLMKSFFTAIEQELQVNITRLSGDGSQLEYLVYSRLHRVFELYVSCLRPDKQTMAQIEQISVTLHNELRYSSNPQRMALLIAAVISATIVYEGASNNELVDVIGTRIYIPKSRINTSVLSHLIHTFNLVDVSAVIHPTNKVELRANRLCAGLDLGKIAELFGGGGQPAAAGFSIRSHSKSVPTIRIEIIAALTEQIVKGVE